MWRNALKYAKKRGFDNLKAVTAVLKAVHITVDGLSNGEPIDDARKYMFGVYLHLLSRIIRDSGVLLKKVGFSEETLKKWIFYIDPIEDKVLSRELFEVMPPQGKRVAVLRFKVGLSWEETARKLNTSVNAAQKALSVGLKKAFDTYMKDKPELVKNEVARRKKKVVE